MSSKEEIPERLKYLLENTVDDNGEINITNIFYESCKQLKSSVLSMSPEFSLNEAMQAVDMMNSQMDSGMIFIDPKTQGLENCLLNGTIDVENINSKELVAIIDATWGVFVSWLNLIPLDQSFYTNVLLHDPNVIINPILKAFMNAFLTISTIFADVIEAINTYSEEDIIIHSYRRQVNISLDMGTVLEQLSIAKEANKFENDDSHEIRDGKTTILYRLRAMETMILLLKLLLPISDNEELGKVNFRDAKQLVSTFKASIKASMQTINYGLQPPDGDDGSYEWLPCFQPEVNKNLLPATFPKRLKCTSREKAYEELRRITSKLEEIVNINEDDICDIEAVGRFLKNFSRNNSCLITRCFAHFVLIPFESKLFGSISLHDLYLRKISQDSAIGLFNRAGNLHDAVYSTISKEWNDYCKIVIELYSNIFQNYSRNISRQMEHISINISETFSALPYTLHFDTILDQRFINDIQLNGKFSSHINSLLLDLSFDYFELGFRTELYLPHEFDYIYWYFFDICMQQSITIYESTISFMENEKKLLDETGSNTTTLKKKQNAYDNSKGISLDKINFNLIIKTSLVYLYKSYFLLICALKRQNLIQKPLMDQEEYRFSVRFNALGPLIKYLQIRYDKYLETKEELSGSKFSLIALYENSLQAINRCVTYLNRIPTNCDHPDVKIVSQLHYICKKNKVAISLLKLQKVPTVSFIFLFYKAFFFVEKD
uniref:Protein MAK10 homolog n=1 Tax=Parastrongyloides trichosuri TaxID=131310 RepID=A0A0N4ZQY2_PARTI